MNYATVTEEQLHTLQQGLDILGHVSRDLLPSTLHLFGLLRPDSPVLAEVNAAVWEDMYAGEERSENIDIKTACVIIRLSDDILAHLLGSGMTLEDSEFCFLLNNEIKTSSFSYAPHPVNVQVSQLVKIALADDSFHAQDFMKTEGMAQDRQNPGRVERTEGAVGGDHGGASVIKHRHQSSLNIKSIAEFLANKGM